MGEETSSGWWLRPHWCWWGFCCWSRSWCWWHCHRALSLCALPHHPCSPRPSPVCHRHLTHMKRPDFRTCTLCFAVKARVNVWGEGECVIYNLLGLLLFNMWLISGGRLLEMLIGAQSFKVEASCRVNQPLLTLIWAILINCDESQYTNTLLAKSVLWKGSCSGNCRFYFGKYLPCVKMSRCHHSQYK